MITNLLAFYWIYVWLNRLKVLWAVTYTTAMQPYLFHFVLYTELGCNSLIRIGDWGGDSILTGAHLRVRSPFYQYAPLPNGFRTLYFKVASALHSIRDHWNMSARNME